ncbi:MAG: tetratricopeptide repeat protein [Flavobacteriales bacterium]|jgi:DNA-binding CsgD family transcriptional regulator|nr:tetratricopeptide repeat protein [Flavobacteriales bacterium]
MGPFKLLVTLYFIGVNFFLIAQNTVENDSILFQQLNLDFQTAVYADIDSSLMIAQQQKALLNKWKEAPKNLNNVEELYLNNMGVYHKMKSDFDSSIYYYEKCLEIFQTKADQHNEATVYNNIANIHYMKGDYPFSLEFHLKSLAIRNQIEDTAGIAMSNANIGLIFESQSEPLKAIEYFEKAAKGFELVQNKMAIAWTYSSLGISYTQTAQYQLADSLLHLSLAIRTELNDNRGKEFCLSSLSSLFLKQAKSHQPICQKDLLKAKEYGVQADSLSKVNGDKWGNISTLNTLGEIYYLNHQLFIAKSYLYEAQKYAAEIESSKELGKTYELLSMVYEKELMYDSSLSYYQQFKLINDSLFSIEKDKEIGRKEAWLEYQNELDIHKLKSENEIKIHKGQKKIQQLISIIIGLSLIIVIFISIFIYRKWQKAQKEKLIVQEENERIEKLNAELEAEIRVIKDKLDNRKEELPPHMDKLSKREMEVLILLGRGLSDKEIAENLFISVTTVRTHNRKIFDKLQIKNRTEALTILNKYKLT